jgi:hypothetical protein
MDVLVMGNYVVRKPRSADAVQSPTTALPQVSEVSH